MRSKIEPMKALAKTLRNKRNLVLLLNWFRADGALSSGVVEGLNNKLKLITRKSYGFRTQKAYETALYHNLGALPEPGFTHRFFLEGKFLFAYFWEPELPLAMETFQTQLLSLAETDVAPNRFGVPGLRRLCQAIGHELPPITTLDRKKSESRSNSHNNRGCSVILSLTARSGI